jgi:hypothetical protein
MQLVAGGREPGGCHVFVNSMSRSQVEVVAMNKAASKVLFSAPRVLGLLFAAFISIFAADAFGEGHGFWDTALRLALHLIPTAVILAILAISWRRELVGAILFTTLAALYSILFWGRFHWSAYAAISGPLLVIGLLFLSDWWCRSKPRTAA